MKRKPNKYQKVISKFINEPKTIWAHPTLIKREMKIAKKLFTIKPEKFWEEAYLPFKLNSLAWFVGKDGAKFIKEEEKRQKLSLKPKQEFKIEEEKVGKDKKILFKPNTLMEFLNGKKK